MYQNNDRLDWHEELRRAGKMEDGFGLLTFGRAWDAVSTLAQTNDPINQEKRINNLWRMYPEAAEKLGLPKLPASQVKPAASSSVESRADPGTKPPKRRHVKLPAPVRTVNTSGGVSLQPSEPKPTEVPNDPPMYFPSDLWPQTYVILLKAQRKFPQQMQTLDLCKHVIAEMTPIFFEAVKAGQMEAGAVQCANGGGMGDLLRSLLVHNDPGPPSGCGLSNEAYRLGQEVKKSDEWLAQARAIEKADRLRTDANQAESTRAQTNARSTQNVESKSTNAAAGNRREGFVRSILEKKGFSVHDWASRAGVDFHTADNYLKGATRPYPATLKKLADALGVEVAKLPA